MLNSNRVITNCTCKYMNVCINVFDSEYLLNQVNDIENIQ